MHNLGVFDPGMLLACGLRIGSAIGLLSTRQCGAPAEPSPALGSALLEPPPGELTPGLAVSTAVSSGEHSVTVAASRLPWAASGIPEVPPEPTSATILPDAVTVAAELSALVEAGLAPAVAEEILLVVDDARRMAQRHRDDSAYQRSRTRLASDILLAVMPELPRLIREKQIAVTATPRALAKGRGSLGFTVFPSGEAIDVEIQGRQWDVVIPLRHEFQADSTLWNDLAMHLGRRPAQGPR